MSTNTTTNGQQNRVAQDDQKVEVSGQSYRYPYRNLVFGGLAAFCTVALTQILTKDSIDTALTISVYCFSFSLPFLVAMIASDIHESVFKYTVRYKPSYFFNMAIVAAFISYVGVIALFWHFGVFVGLIFGVTSLFCINIHIKLANKVETLNMLKE